MTTLRGTGGPHPWRVGWQRTRDDDCPHSAGLVKAVSACYRHSFPDPKRTHLKWRACYIEDDFPNRSRGASRTNLDRHVRSNLAKTTMCQRYYSHHIGWTGAGAETINLAVSTCWQIPLFILKKYLSTFTLFFYHSSYKKFKVIKNQIKYNLLYNIV
jgi:hypothetical protein